MVAVKRFSGKLGAKARRAILTAPQVVVSGLVRLTPSADVAALQVKIAALGGKVRSSMTEADLLSVEVPASRLSDLADLPGVSYVEAGERYAPDSTR